MSKDDTKDLLKFYKPFPKEIRETALWLREWVWDQYPHANELIYDAYNAVAIGWSLTDKLGHMFCGVGIYRANNNIHFSFYWGKQLKDPKNILLGQGSKYRYILVNDKKTFPRAYIKQLMTTSHALALAKIKDLKEIKEGLTITKAVYDKKRKPTSRKK